MRKIAGSKWFVLGTLIIVVVLAGMLLLGDDFYLSKKMNEYIDNFFNKEEVINEEKNENLEQIVSDVATDVEIANELSSTITDDVPDGVNSDSINDIDISKETFEPLISDECYEVEGLTNFPILHKSINKKYEAYCLDMDEHYDRKIVYEMKEKLDDGFAVILNNRPVSNNKDRDYYITQMAVWFYVDFLNDNNEQLVKEVKAYIYAHKDNDYECEQIYNLYNAARYYDGSMKLEPVYSYCDANGEFQPLLIDFNTAK